MWRCNITRSLLRALAAGKLYINVDASDSQSIDVKEIEELGETEEAEVTEAEKDEEIEETESTSVQKP